MITSEQCCSTAVPAEWLLYSINSCHARFQHVALHRIQLILDALQRSSCMHVSLAAAVAQNLNRLAAPPCSFEKRLLMAPGHVPCHASTDQRSESHYCQRTGNAAAWRPFRTAYIQLRHSYEAAVEQGNLMSVQLCKISHKPVRGQKGPAMSSWGEPGLSKCANIPEHVQLHYTVFAGNYTHATATAHIPS